MDLIQDKGAGDYHIMGYGDHYVQVNQQKLTQNFIIAPTQLVESWPVAAVTELTEQHLQTILTVNPQPALVVLGTGAQLAFPEPEHLAFFYQHNVGFEMMTTPAACRTYNVLMAEGRDIVFALIV